MHKKFILASSSKSRHKILKNCGFKFMQKEPVCDEENIKKTLSNKKPADFVKNLSYQKAISINKIDKFFNYFIIGCDTVIYLDKVRFDKAKNIKEAAKKIKRLSGKTHKIISGVTICNKGKKICPLRYPLSTKDKTAGGVHFGQLYSLQCCCKLKYD